MAISMELRIRIFEARQSGESTSEVAERFAVSPAFVRRLMQRYRESGSLAPSSAPRGRKPRLSGHVDQLRQLHAEQPDLTASEIRGADQCNAFGCILASAFFPDAGRHDLNLYPKLFTLGREEQVETFIHEIGHVFGLRHFFANVSEQA